MVHVTYTQTTMNKLVQLSTIHIVDNYFRFRLWTPFVVDVLFVFMDVLYMLLNPVIWVYLILFDGLKMIDWIILSSS